MSLMKRFVSAVFVLLFAAMVALGQGLDDEYVQIFRLIQEADTLSSSAPSQALAKYLDAQAALDRLHKGSPDWNTRIVRYRLSYLANRIAALSANNPLPAATPQSNPPPATAVPPAGTSSAPADWQAQLTSVQQQLQQAQSDKALLEAKLKEALALRPAAADPAELAKAEDRIKELQKENDLLRVTKANQASAPAVDANALEQARKSLDDSRRQLATQTDRLSKLTLEKEALEAKLKSSGSDVTAVSELRTENQLLKQKLAEAQSSTPTRAIAPDSNRQLTEAKAQIESLQLEKTALENRVKQLSGTSAGTSMASAAPSSAESARIKQLESERDSLQRRLDEATRKLYGRKGKGSPSQVADLENQLAMERTRMEILEARAVPYTQEELELLKTPQPKLAEADPKAGKKSIKELPPGAANLVAEAQRCFAAKQYDKAESAYLQVLNQDPKNVPTLGNLAAIEVEAGHLDKAETNIKQALALDPDDPYSLYVLGILRFRQTKYDDALDALARSAKLDPQNAEVQNYLGLTLSEKGMRIPAEAALRKAVELQPGYAGAHYNLAVVYATEQPPATALARWHYEKAIAAGYPRNPDLEKRFDARQ